MNDPHFEVYPQKHESTCSCEVRSADPSDHPELCTIHDRGDPVEWGWRFQAGNGQISAIGGEGFTRPEDAHRAVHDFCSALAALFWAGAHPIVRVPIHDVEQ